MASWPVSSTRLTEVRTMKAKLARLAGLVASAVTSASAFAAAPDVSAVVTEIGGTAAPSAAIGAAVLLVFVGIKTFKWVRRAM